MSDSPGISFSNVSFNYEDEPVLTNLSFKAGAGEHTVIKGDSGSGKSTLLKLLLGFCFPDEGTISLQNNHWSPQNIRKQTAWLPQDLNLGKGLTRHVLQKPFEFAANSFRQISESLKVKTLHKLGLSPDILDKTFRDLSTGQRQRLGIAICHLLDKPLLLLDEPTSALDKTSKERAFNMLIGHTSKTTVSVSHDPYWLSKADIIIELT